MRQPVRLIDENYLWSAVVWCGHLLLNSVWISRYSHGNLYMLVIIDTSHHTTELVALLDLYTNIKTSLVFEGNRHLHLQPGVTVSSPEYHLDLAGKLKHCAAFIENPLF